MATLLDTSLLKFLLPLFSFIFVMVLVYAVMDKFSLVGNNKLIHWTVAFSIAFIFLFSSDAVRFLNLLTPWFILLGVFGLFLVSFFVFLGVSKEDIVKGALKDAKVYWTVIGISALVFFIALGVVFSDTVGPEGPRLNPQEADVQEGDAVSPIREGIIQGAEARGGAVESGIGAIVHPRVLGALFILIIIA